MPVMSLDADVKIPMLKERIVAINRRVDGIKSARNDTARDGSHTSLIGCD